MIPIFPTNRGNLCSTLSVPMIMTRMPSWKRRLLELTCTPGLELDLGRVCKSREVVEAIPVVAVAAAAVEWSPLFMTMKASALTLMMLGFIDPATFNRMIYLSSILFSMVPVFPMY